VRSDFFESFGEFCLSFKGAVVLCQYSHPIISGFRLFFFVCLSFGKRADRFRFFGDSFESYKWHFLNTFLCLLGCFCRKWINCLLLVSCSGAVSTNFYISGNNYVTIASLCLFVCVLEESWSLVLLVSWRVVLPLERGCYALIKYVSSLVEYIFFRVVRCIRWFNFGLKSYLFVFWVFWGCGLSLNFEIVAGGYLFFAVGPISVSRSN